MQSARRPQKSSVLDVGSSNPGVRLQTGRRGAIGETLIHSVQLLSKAAPSDANRADRLLLSKKTTIASWRFFVRILHTTLRLPENTSQEKKKKGGKERKLPNLRVLTICLASRSWRRNWRKDCFSSFSCLSQQRWLAQCREFWQARLALASLRNGCVDTPII